MSIPIDKKKLPPKNKRGSKRIDRTGELYGEWTVLKFSHLDERRAVCWECKCSCGTVRTIVGSDLAHGSSKSCGCKIVTHGMTGTPEYRAWLSLRQRCYNKKNKNYPNYGGRGITVCARWRETSQNFLDDMGLRPSKLYSIDRINVNGNYEPENCRWATKTVQVNNRRCSGNATYTHNGKTLTITEWSKESNIAYDILYSRLVICEWSIEKTLSISIHHKNSHCDYGS